MWRRTPFHFQFLSQLGALGYKPENPTLENFSKTWLHGIDTRLDQSQITQPGFEKDRNEGNVGMEALRAPASRCEGPAIQMPE